MYFLACADDIMLLTEDVGGIKGILRIMEKYFEGKGLKVNVKKTKVMRCRKGGGKRKKVVWRWKG